MNSMGKRLAMALLVLFVGMGFFDYARLQGREVQEEQEAVQEKASGLNLWYTDGQIKPYLEAVAQDYLEKCGVQIHCTYMSADDYVKNIYDVSVSGEAEMPDLYLIRNDKLERACMAGVTAVISEYEDICTKKNFAQTALDAVTYQGHYIACPLYYNTVCMMYNKGALATPPANMDELMHYAENGQIPENTEQIFAWNCNDYLTNYSFISNSIELAGSSGDHAEDCSVVSDAAIRGLTVWNNVAQYFAVNQSRLSADYVTQGFVEGRILCILADSAMVNKVERAKQGGTMTAEYGIAGVLGLTAAERMVAASYTETLAVNGMSPKQQLAADFMEFIVLEEAKKLYETAGCLTAYKKVEYPQPELNKMYKIYEQSKQFPKLYAAEDIWMKLEVLFSNVAGGSDITQEFQNFYTQLTGRLH